MDDEFDDLPEEPVLPMIRRKKQRTRPANMDTSWMATPPGKKLCGSCNRELPATYEFYGKDEARDDGFTKWCKECRSERRKMKELDKAADVIKALDAALLANIAKARPGGSSVPHLAELYQLGVQIFGGPQGLMMHYAATFKEAKPGSMTRERLLSNFIKMGMVLSDSKKVNMPAELLEDADLLAEVEKREAQMKVVDAEVTDVE